MCRGKDGDVRLEGTCGLVISGRTDPSNPLFTPGGSFWTNDSFALLDIPPDEDPRLHPRNQCIQQGYASIALVPIRNKDRIIGLIQLNDRRKECFTLAAVEILEEIASHIGAALMRKQVEAKLRLSEVRYRTLVENIPQRVLLKDRESNYISINNAYARAFGLNPEQVSGKSDYDFHPKELAEKFRQEDRLVMETGESREFEEENIENGNKRILHKVKVPVRDKTGKIIGVLATLSDITDRLQLEEQFRHSQKMEAVGRLAGGIAHDFNNLLTVIGGHTEIALARIGKIHPLRDNLQEAKIATDRASSLTRQLLAFSRRQVMQIRVLNLNTVIRDTEKMLRQLLGEDIAVITQPSENLGLVKADPGQIEQVLTNLAVNARDAMPDGGRLVIATDNLEITEADDPMQAGLNPGRYVRISVSDTGQGMNPEVLSKIFEPFFTTKEQGKGTGLGLSTVFGIVKQSRRGNASA